MDKTPKKRPWLFSQMQIAGEAMARRSVPSRRTRTFDGLGGGVADAADP